MREHDRKCEGCGKVVRVKVAEVPCQSCGGYTRDMGLERMLKRIADLDAALAMEKVNVAFEKARIRTRNVLNKIDRICPDCGDDMCGDNHKDCWKCKALKVQRYRQNGSSMLKCDEGEWVMHTELAQAMKVEGKDAKTDPF